MAKNRILLAHQAWINFLKIKSVQNLAILREKMKKGGVCYKHFSKLVHHGLDVPEMTLEFVKEYILCKEHKEINEWARKINQDFSPQGKFARLTFSEKIPLRQSN
jgi:hypothetical protein